MFFGHTHVALVFGQPCSEYGEATRHEFGHTEPFRLDASDRYIVCVGSVAYVRDAVGKIRYAIYDHDQDAVEMRPIGGPVLVFHAAR